MICRRLLAISAALALATACSSEYGLSSSPSEDDPEHLVSGSRGDDTNAHAFKVNRQQGDKADFLFVVDPSVSMLKVLKDMRTGFQSLDPSAFSRDTRIAVMTTTPASADGTRPHPAVDREGALRDPGFQKLISGSDLAAWKGRKAQEGACGDGWFAPTDTLADGTPCLEAVTTLPLYPANAEAGLVALKQFLLLQGDEPLFRDGAAVNIVFVSDTHDPGVPEGVARDALVGYRPDYAELAELVDRANVVSSLKVHAIAPMENCVEVEDFSGIGTSYYDVALASGGRIVDICQTTDYTKILHDLASVGGMPDMGVLDLGPGAKKVLGVEMNGKKVDWTAHRGGRFIRVDRKLADGDNEFRVITER